MKNLNKTKITLGLTAISAVFAGTGVGVGYAIWHHKTPTPESSIAIRGTSALAGQEGIEGTASYSAVSNIGTDVTDDAVWNLEGESAGISINDNGVLSWSEEVSVGEHSFYITCESGSFNATPLPVTLNLADPSPWYVLSPNKADWNLFFNITEGTLTSANLQSTFDEAWTNSSYTSIDLSTFNIIGESAFEGCASLSSNGPRYVDIIWTTSAQNSLIGDSAFWGCHKISSIILPKSGTFSIDKRAFYNTGLRNVLLPPNCTAKLASVGDYAFAWNVNLENISLPNGSFAIGDAAFVDCKVLQKLIPNTSTMITSIGNEVFDKCPNLTTNGIIALENHIDQNNLTFRQNGTDGAIIFMKNWGERAFLASGDLGQCFSEGDIISIGDSMFRYCESIQGIDLSKLPISGSVGAGAFADCVGLEEISLPSGINQINSQAFYNCLNLSILHWYNSTTPTIGSQAFDGVSIKGKLNVTSEYLTTNNIKDGDLVTRWNGLESKEWYYEVIE